MCFSTVVRHRRCHDAYLRRLPFIGIAGSQGAYTGAIMFNITTPNDGS